MAYETNTGGSNVFVISDGHRSATTAMKALGKSMAVCGVSMNEFLKLASTTFSTPCEPIRIDSFKGLYSYIDSFLSYKEDFEDHGPDFDNRSWAFCREQREAFNKKNKFKKYLFQVIVNHRKLYKLKSMDSRSGYRGVKTLKRG